MSSTVVWFGSTVAFWVICTLAYAVIEALVDDYWARIAVMIVAGRRSPRSPYGSTSLR